MGPESTLPGEFELPVSGGLVTGAEGHGIAAWLNRHGITGDTDAC